MEPMNILFFLLLLSTGSLLHLDTKSLIFMKLQLLQVIQEKASKVS